MFPFVLLCTAALLGSASAAPSAAPELARRNGKTLSFCNVEATFQYPEPTEVANRNKYADARFYYSADIEGNAADWRIYVYTDPDAHILYETEHIFEAQTLSVFFNQRCDHLGGDIERVTQPAVNQLGTRSHPDRIVMLENDLNVNKASFFKGNLAVSRSKVDSAMPAQQLAYAQNIALVVHYMNEERVWNRFCNTYFAIYDALGDNAIGDDLRREMQGAFPGYVRGVLATFTDKVRENMDYINEHKDETGHEQEWAQHRDDAPLTVTETDATVMVVLATLTVPESDTRHPPSWLHSLVWKLAAQSCRDSTAALVQT